MYQQVSGTGSDKGGGVSLEDSKMAKSASFPGGRNQKSAASFVSDCIMFLSGASVALLLVWSIWSFSNPSHSAPNISHSSSPSSRTVGVVGSLNRPSERRDEFDGEGQQEGGESYDPNFYDDPELTYTMEGKVKDWDYKRQQWLNQHPSYKLGSSKRVLLVSGSQPAPCTNPMGDHMLLRFFKNKVDYCRIHGYDIFYNNVLLQPEMFTFWAKYPAVRAAMIAHPEAEWIWWVDSDAAFTDMDFKLPLERYLNHNLVIHGWEKALFEKRSWVALNAGVFLIRNCQWSLDFMEKWAGMGPQSPDYEKWGEIQRKTFADKLAPESDDQTGLAYLILNGEKKWTDKIYMEGEYYFEGYWVEIVGTLDYTSEKYVEVEERVRRLRRRRAEKMEEYYGGMLAEELNDMGVGYEKGSWRRPFITHFTGCQPCSGDHNQLYTDNSCLDGMNKALNFADNQVLRNFGYYRPNLVNTSAVSALPFDYPA